MTAKDRHKQVLLAHIADWDNDFPTRNRMAEILGVKRATLTGHFSPAEMDAILAEGLELRKKHSYRQRGAVYTSMLAEAKSGNIAAQKEFLERTEGKVVEKHEHTGKDGKDLFPELSDEELDRRILALTHE